MSNFVFLPRYLSKQLKQYYSYKFKTFLKIKIIKLCLQLQQYWMKNNVYVMIKPIYTTDTFNNNYKYWIWLNYHLYKKICMKFSIRYSYFLIWISLKTNNSILLSLTLKKILTTFNLRWQRLILVGILNFIKFCLITSKTIYNILGITIDIRGKIGRAGSVRKKRIYFKWGNYSYNTLHYKLSSYTTHSPNKAGVLGISTNINYKVKLNTILYENQCQL